MHPLCILDAQVDACMHKWTHYAQVDTCRARTSVGIHGFAVDDHSLHQEPWDSVVVPD